MRASSRARPALARLAEERGFSVVEGVVAALLLTLGALAVLQVFDAATRNNFRAEQSQVVNNRLQAELERIRALPYSQIALTGYPAPSADANDPRSRVAGTSFAVDRGATGSPQQLVVNGSPRPSGGTVSGGTLAAGPQPFSAGDVSGQIFRFVTWADASCPACEVGTIKRVVVAARVDEAPVSFERAFQEVQTEIADPEVKPNPNPAPPGESQEGQALELWLTDTGCDEDARRRPEADHETHDTRGVCEEGTRTGGQPGAPDLMVPEAPELDGDHPPAAQPLYDYSADVGGSADGVGLTMPSAAGEQCGLAPPIGSAAARSLRLGVPTTLPAEPGPRDGLLSPANVHENEHLRIHVWLSPVVGAPAELLGQGTLDLWTRSVGATLHPGEICITAFTRRAVSVPWSDGGGSGEAEIEVDVPLANVGGLTQSGGLVCQPGLGGPYLRCSLNQWPTLWSKVSVPLAIAAYDAWGNTAEAVLEPGSRLGIVVTVREPGTEPGQGLELMYDHVDFESRLQLRTDSLVCFGAC